MKTSLQRIATSARSTIPRRYSQSAVNPAVTSRIRTGFYSYSHISSTSRYQTSPFQLQSSITRAMSSIPATQKGVQVSKIGGPEVLEYKTDLPVPSPKEGEVLVKNNLTAINLIDTYFRKGVYESAKPEIPGKEGAGTIVALGPGPNPYNFAVGDRVAWLGGGGYAEYSIAPATRVAKIPSGVSDEKVLAALLTGATCLSFIREAYEVKKGDWILLHAAAGGAGIIMTQLLKLAGAKVIGTAGGPEKVEIVKGLGADVVIDYKSSEGANWLEKVKEVTGGEGVDAVYDSVGKDTWEDSLKAVKRKGSVVFFGNSSGVVPPFPISILGAKNVKICRPVLFNYIYTREEFDLYMNELFQLLESDKLKTSIYKVYPLEDIQQAHKDIEGRRTTGKLLIKP